MNIIGEILNYSSLIAEYFKFHPIKTSLSFILSNKPN